MKSNGEMQETNFLPQNMGQLRWPGTVLSQTLALG